MWVKVDDSLPRHPKFIAAGDRLGKHGVTLAIGFFVQGLCYAATYLTDGLIPRVAIRGFLSAQPTAVVDALVAVGLWEVVEGGYRIHDYHDYNPSAEQIRAQRAKKAEAGMRGGLAKWRTDSLQNRQNSRTRAERLTTARAKGTHTAEEWAALRDFFGCCVRCGATPTKLLKDHIIPIYQGGSDAITNLQPLCQTCNLSKGAEAVDYRTSCRSGTPPEWLPSTTPNTTPSTEPGVHAPQHEAKTPSTTPNTIEAQVGDEPRVDGSGNAWQMPSSRARDPVPSRPVVRTSTNQVESESSTDGLGSPDEARSSGNSPNPALPSGFTAAAPPASHDETEPENPDADGRREALRQGFQQLGASLPDAEVEPKRPRHLADRQGTPEGTREAIAELFRTEVVPGLPPDSTRWSVLAKDLLRVACQAKNLAWSRDVIRQVMEDYRP